MELKELINNKEKMKTKYTKWQSREENGNKKMDILWI